MKRYGGNINASYLKCMLLSKRSKSEKAALWFQLYDIIEKAKRKEISGSERPAHRDEEWPPLATTRESPHTETKTQHSQK